MGKPPKNKELLNEAEIVKRFEQYGIKLSHLRSWRQRGLGPSYYKIGGAIRYTPEDVEKFIESSRIENA